MSYHYKSSNLIVWFLNLYLLIIPRVWYSSLPQSNLLNSFYIDWFPLHVTYSIFILNVVILIHFLFLFSIFSLIIILYVFGVIIFHHSIQINWHSFIRILIVIVIIYLLGEMLRLRVTWTWILFLKGILLGFFMIALCVSEKIVRLLMINIFMKITEVERDTIVI